MSEKKRKADATQTDRPTKKAAQGQTKPKLRVDFVAGSDIAKPVIAITPGVALPSKLQFQSFIKKTTNGRSDLILHSSTHPTIDFKATEGELNADKYLKHYIAIFDPAKNTLQVTEAKKLTARGCVRQRAPAVDSDDEETEVKAITNFSSRAALTHAFGTKKSKKAVQASAENRLYAQGGKDDATNPLSSAILSSMPSPEPSEDRPVSQPVNKPLPVPDLTTSDINEVYPMSSLVFPHPSSSTLEEMPLGYWRETIGKRGDIVSPSRFISSRVAYLVSALPPDPSNSTILLKVQLLRYTLLLIELYKYLCSIPRFKKIPPISAWPPKTISGNISHEILAKLSKHFAPDGTGLGKNQKILLQSTILALTLHIPPPSLKIGASVLITEMTDIQLDLAMEPGDVRKLYRELGCKVEHPKPGELERWGLQKESKTAKDGKAAVPRSKFAKLSFPLDFPVQRMGMTPQRRR